MLITRRSTQRLMSINFYFDCLGTSRHRYKHCTRLPCTTRTSVKSRCVCACVWRGGNNMVPIMAACTNGVGNNAKNSSKHFDLIAHAKNLLRTFRYFRFAFRVKLRRGRHRHELAVRSRAGVKILGLIHCKEFKYAYFFVDNGCVPGLGLSFQWHNFYEVRLFL